MNITDKAVKAIVKYIDMVELTESIESFPEDERNGKTDLEIVADEISYYLHDFYEEDGNVFSGDLEESRRILKETKNGKFIPISLMSYAPIYSRSRIENAKSTVSEYRRLKRGEKKIEDLRRARA